ncbi:MAG: DUF4026 domain-containing protein [Planctomycetes bacterium]|nr:DUF4026 domain-containing protein [Planctomycetota bacterium]
MRGRNGGTNGCWGKCPSRLALYWRGEEPPMEYEVANRLGTSGYRGEETEFEEDPGVLWAQAVRLEDHSMPFFVWAEGRPSEDPLLLYNRVRWRDESELDAARSARWMIYVETLLEREDPVRSYQRQLSVAAALADDLVVACLDVSSFTLRSNLSLRELASSPAPPRPDALYTIHLVYNGDEEAWLHTHGLARAGAPELDILGVGRGQARVAGEVLQALSAQLLDAGAQVEETGGVHVFGHDLAVQLVPWRDAVEELSPGALGGARDRQDEFHGGFRFVCGEATGNALDGSFVPLAPTLERMAGNPVVYVTHAETRRMEILARERWPLAAMAFFSLEPHDRRLLVKLGYRVDGGKETDREHLWFEVLTIGKGTVEAKLLNEPYHIGRMKADEVGGHDLALLTDFTLSTPQGTFTPETIGEFGELDLFTDPAREQGIARR